MHKTLSKTSFAIILILLSLCLEVFSAESKTSRKKLTETPINKQSSNSLLLETGLNTSILASDISSDAFGFGVGEQYSIAYHFWKQQKNNILVRLEYVNTEQELVTNSKDFYPDTKIKSLEQSYYFLSLNNQQEWKENFYWQWGLGLSMGQESTIEYYDLNTNAVVSDEEMTRSFLFATIGATYYYNVYKNFDIISSIRSNLLLHNLYSDHYKSTSFFMLPVQFNFGLAYIF